MKKGELMTGQIVGFILLIVAFVIILWVYSSIAFPKQIDETVCHESVVARATVSAVIGSVAGTPLQCKTKKICLGGDCGEFAGAKNVLNIEDVDDEKDIEKEVAQEMVNCWTMMGEGKADVFSTDIPTEFKVSEITSTCVICSRIAINENAIGGVNVEEVDVIDYMFRHKVPGKDISYYEFFSGDSSGVTVANDLIGDTPGEELASEVAIIFMQADDEDGWYELAKKDVLAVFGVGVAAKASGVSFLTMKAIGKVKGVGVVGGVVAGIVAIVGGGVQAYNVYNNREIIAGYCGDVSLGEGEGCSVVRAIPYNVENLRNYCGYIESIA